MIKEAIGMLAQHQDLTEQEAGLVMNEIMEGQATQAQIGAFLTALKMKGEKVDELTGFARVMRDKAISIHPTSKTVIDTCGTGGDFSGTFNISTTCAFVAAGAGLAVAKHGNRAATSKSGSADVLEELGVNLEATPDVVQKALNEVGIAFLFARAYHQSMRFVAGPRQEIGIRTVFNLLGPLTNPAKPDGQVLGVYDEKLTETIAEVLKNLGIKRAMVVHGLEGMDEISILGKTKVSEVRDGQVTSYFLDPESFGFRRAEPGEIKGGDPKANAATLLAILEGREKGAKRDIVLLNSAAALVVGGLCDTLQQGIEKAAAAIDNGKALEKLEQLKRMTAQ